jgi:hypothetical protein
MFRRSPLLLFLLGAACSSASQADLPSISEARSLVAEWALVNELAARGRINATYTATMRQELRQHLQTTASALTLPQSSYGGEIRACLQLRDDASPTALRGHVDRLKQIEDSLESA